MRAYVLISAIVLPVCAVAACASEPQQQLKPNDQPPADIDTAKAFFDDHVLTIFETRCAECHANPADEQNAPDYLGTATAEYYTRMVERTDFVGCNPQNSLLLNKGADTDHAGGSLTEDESQKIGTWLEIEANVRFGSLCGGGAAAATATGSTSGGSSDPPEQVLTGTKAMEQFGACMTYKDWIDTGMPLVTNQDSNLGGIVYNDCYSCHNTDQGMNLMPDPNIEVEVEEAFAYMRNMYASFNLVTWTVNDEDGSFKDLVKSNRWRDKGIEAQAAGSSHPEYELSAEYQATYEAWFDLTYAKWKAGDCDAAGAGGGAGVGGGGGAGGAPDGEDQDL
jgi:hypothetical protein